MGEGPYQLLRRIEKLGSLRRAALEMGMSYSKAHALIKHLEASVQHQILHSYVGGSSGGGAQLTDFGRRLLKEYAELEKRVSGAADAAFAEFCANMDLEP